ncbi:BppU family phage baseplate upper protein [Enterococcus faecium]
MTITGFTFKSYDKKAGVLQFEIKNQDGSPTDLIDATVRLFMYIYQGEEKKEFPIFDNQIITESYMQGIVKYPIPDMLLSYEGKVDANVYIDFPDGSHTDNLAFTFNIEKSVIDDNVQLNGEYYFKDFQQLLDGVKQEATDAVNEVLAKVDSSTAKMQELEQRIDEQTEIFNNADVYNKAEIEDKLEPFALRTDIDRLSIEKADKEAVLADSNKFRTDIAEVSAQLAETDEGVNAVNLRVDNLVIPLSPENTNIEVTDAHNSIVKNKNFSSLKERLEESEGELVQYRLDYATLESNIDAIVPNINVKNLMRGTILTHGKYIVPDTGAMSNNSTYSSSDFIEISPSVAYELYIEKQCYGAWYDSDNIFISGLSSNTTGALTLDIVSPANAKFIRISGNTSEINKFTLKIKDTEALFLNPLINVSDSQILKSSTAKVLKVKPLGGGDFTTLRSAFESITDSSPTNRYVVEFYGDGTEYNVADEYPSLVGMVGLMIPSYTKLVGVGGKTKNILVARLAEPNADFSTLNMRSSAEIEGIKAIGYNTRYVVHDDFFNTVDINSSRIIKDCEFISEKTYYGRAWGAGIRSGCKWKFENCKFVGLYGTNETAYSCHNNVDFDAETEQIFENCRFIGTYTGHKVRFGSITTNANGILNNVIFKGCKIGHLRLNEENAGVSGTGILFKVSGYANDITSAEIINTDEVDYTSYVDLI